MIKILISYDMQRGKEAECQEYLSRRVAPLLNQQGFELRDIWYTLWGESPQILGGGTVENMEQARSVFLSDEWREVEDELGEITHNFRVRLVPMEDA
ncbi:MAG: hypothetical protein KDD92_01550 [Caldilineaceae bacterium]|nr:hypothetical protein [Caldilineaceae bacterium]